MCATTLQMGAQRRSMEVEHKSIGADDVGRYASVIALLLAACILEAKN